MTDRRLFGGGGLTGFTTIILAAGMGSRMKSSFAKVVHPLCGVPMIDYIADTVKKAGSSRTVVVVGHQAERVKAAIREDVEFAYQAEQKGTGHAVLQAEALLSDVKGPVLVTYGDTPLYRAETFRDFVAQHVETKAAATVLTAMFQDPTGYGRVVRSSEGSFERIVEQKDASEEEAAIREINTGTYCFDGQDLFRGLRSLKPDNAQGEYYLPDVLTLLGDEGRSVHAQIIEDATEALGINDRHQLADAERVLRDRIKEHWFHQGVTIIDPSTTWIDARVSIGADTILFPFTMLEGDTIIGERCRIGPFSHLRNARIGNNSSVERSFVQGARFGLNSSVGPDARHVTSDAQPRCEWLFNDIEESFGRGEE